MNEPKSARYHRLSRRTALLSSAATAALLLVFQAGPASALRDAAERVSGGGPDSPGTVAVFAVALAVAYQLVVLPLRFYGTFLLERRYGLSSEPLRAWLIDHLKAGALLTAFALVAAEVLYQTLRWSPRWWWAASALCLSGGLAATVTLGPVALMPLFYRFAPLERESLRARLELLCARAGLPVMGVYVWVLGHRTRRANAALVGSGRTRRILLSDTLLEKYTDDEIEVIMAHELGHHVHRDIAKGLLAEAGVLALALAAAAVALDVEWGRLGLEGPADVAGLPLLVVVAGAVSFVLGPVLKAISRRNERRADRYALGLTDRPDAFASAMRRLAAQNLADETPSRMARWLFHTHPTLADRLETAREFAQAERELYSAG